VFTLTRRESSPVPLEVDGILPSKVANLSALEVARLEVQHGNRREPLGEFFEVRSGSQGTRADLLFAGDTSNVHGIGLGLDSGVLFVENAVGRHAGAKMTGGSLVLDSDVGDWLGAEMTGGSIEVRGSVANQAGAAYRGSRRGMRGGVIRIRGGAGDELGLLMRRGAIRVDGSVGEFAGASMIAGSMLLLGGTGARLGAGMKRGTIVTAGDVKLPSSFRYACRFQPSFLGLFTKLFEDLPASFGQEEMDCYRGDLLTGGRGEVLVHGPA